MSYHEAKKQYNKTYSIVETGQHKNGFTLYKIITKEVVASQSLDWITEYFVWKRYNDFKALHVGLFKIHRELYLPGRFPGFIKPKLFGRFDKAVINERKKCAQELLDFACQHKPLYLSNLFKQFFQGSKRLNENRELTKLSLQPLMPSSGPINETESNESCGNSSHENVLKQSDLELFDPCANKADNTSADFIQNEWLAVVRDSSNFQKPKEAENCAAIVAQTDTNIDSAADSIPSDSNLNFDLNIDNEIHFDNPEALNSELEELKIDVSEVEMASYHSVSLQNDVYTNSTTILPDSMNKNNIHVDVEDDLIKNSDLTRNDVDLKEEHRRSSKARAYLNQLLERKRLSSESEGNEQEMKPSSLTDQSINGGQLKSIKSHGNLLSNSTGTQHSGQRRSSLPGPQPEIKSSSLMDLKRFFLDNLENEEEKGLYLVEAGQQISLAHNAMSKEEHQTAFLCYKSAINILLQGVQGDSDEIRIQAVRRKTAKYLKKAEDIHQNYLKTMLNSATLWTDDQTPISNLEENDPARTRSSSNDRVSNLRDANSLPRIPSPRHTSKDLLNYKVIGIMEKVLLVLDAASSKAFVIKILRKSTRKSNRIKKAVIPTNVPFMVKLHRFFSTVTSIYLVLEHAQGGRLWENLTNFMVEEILDTKTRTDRTHHHKPAEKAERLDGETVAQSTPIKPKISSGVNELESSEANSPSGEASDSENSHRTLTTAWSFLSEEDNFAESPSVMETPSREKVTTPEQSPTPHLFTIDSVSTLSDGEDNELQFDVSDGSQFKGTASRRMSDVPTDAADFEAELLSEQDLSAVFCPSGRSRTFTGSPPGQTLCPPAGSPSLAHLHIGESPSPSLGSSVEGDEAIPERISEEEESRGGGIGAVERSINEHGISTADPTLIFRSVSSKCPRSKSTSSFAEKNLGNAGEFDPVFEPPENGGKDAGDEVLLENSVDGLLKNMEKDAFRSYRIPECSVQRWGAELIIAIGTLHSVGILCRNLSPNNILLDANGHVRMTYFGKWKQVELPSSLSCSNGLYSAPEITNVTAKKTVACDWWSLGALLYELLVGKSLLEQHPSGINNHTVLHFPDFISKEAKSLLTGLLQFYPNQRLGFGVRGLDDLMGHPFFDNVDWDKLIDNYGRDS